jgi:hypothetical protein
MLCLLFNRYWYDTHDGVGDAETYRYLASLLRKRDKKPVKIKKAVAQAIELPHLPEDTLLDLFAALNQELRDREKAARDAEYNALREELTRLILKAKADLAADELLLMTLL